MKSWLCKNPLAYLAVTMWRCAEGYRRQAAFYMTLSLGAMGTWLSMPLVVSHLMNTIQNAAAREVAQEAALPLLLLFGLGMAGWAMHGPSRVMERRIAFLIRAKFLAVLFQNVTSLPMRWHKEHHSGETIDQVEKAKTALGDFAESGFEVIGMLTHFLGALVILGLFMPMAALVVCAVTVVVVTAIVLFDRVLVRQYETLNKRYNLVAARVQDFLTNVSTVICLRLEGRAGREVRERTMENFALARKNARLNELKWFVTSALMRLTQVAVLFGYLLQASQQEGKLEIGTFYALYEYLRWIGDAFFQFTYKYGDLVVQSTRVRAAEHIQRSYSELVQPVESAVLPRGWREILIRGLSFSHAPEGLHGPQIEAPELRLGRGTWIAFVGESGCGKSTTMALLRGILSAREGEVYCDGQHLPYGLAHVSHCVTLVPQEPEIFAGTVRFNITLGIEADPAAIMRAVALAQFGRVLDRLPRGLDTDIAEKGVNLSGGEKQRLALARGLFFVEEAGSEIVLMDEPTSSVDQLNDRLIYKGLRERFSRHCVISSLHKLHLLPLFDEVVVFERGRVVEQVSVRRFLERRRALTGCGPEDSVAVA